MRIKVLFKAIATPVRSHNQRIGNKLVYKLANEDLRYNIDMLDKIGPNLLLMH